MNLSVQLEQLHKRFGAFVAVDHVSFTAGRGEVVGFLGPNGAGKSTTMKMLTGFLTPTSGRVVVNGLDLARRPVAVKQQLGYLPEGAPAYSDMTPRDFLAFIADIRGLRGSRRQQRLKEVIDQVHLDSVLDQPIDTLSKGFKRRVGLAQAILHDPPILVLDEPTDGLDPNQKHEVRELIRHMAQEKLIILSTHILEEVNAVCSRVLIIAQGQLRVDSTPAELAGRSERHQAVTLAIRTQTAKNARETLSRLPGVRHVELIELNKKLERYCIYPAPGRLLLAEVAQVAREQQWGLEELHVERGELDTVFRSLTTQPHTEELH